MDARQYPPLSADLRSQLHSVTSADGIIFPCSVTTSDGQEIDRVYVAAAAPWIAQWGIWPEDDPGKKSVDIQKIVLIKRSLMSLPERFAAKLYSAGESGMGYTVFTVAFRDGSRQAYVTGNAIDFINYPPGQSPSTVANVLPHVGREDPGLKNGPSYSWCLFGDG